MQLVSDDEPLISNYPGLDLDDSEKIIIYKLAQNGPSNSENELAKRMKFFLKEQPKWKASSQHNSLVRAAIRRLQQKGFVKTNKTRCENCENIKVELTFHGLFLYLYQRCDMEEDYWNAYKKNRYLFPFNSLWDKMWIRFEEDMRSAFDKTLRKCRQLKREEFSIDALDAKFEGFIKWRSIITSKEETKAIERKRNMVFLSFLKDQNSKELLMSYIAYLIIQDMPKIQGKTKSQIESLVFELQSEKELALLENRQIKSNSLLIANRIGEFFPKYGSVEFFFTGMFVNNLLWK